MLNSVTLLLSAMRIQFLTHSTREPDDVTFWLRESSLRYPALIPDSVVQVLTLRFTTFSTLIDKGETARPAPRSSSDFTSTIAPAAATTKILVCLLDRKPTDDSKWDFAVVCELLRSDLDETALWEFVHSRSKFNDQGWDYFRVTAENAGSSLCGESP